MESETILRELAQIEDRVKRTLEQTRWFANSGTGHALGQVETAGVDIEMTLRTHELQWTSRSLPSRIRSSIVTGLILSGFGLRRLLASLRSFSSSTSSGRRAISMEIRRASSSVSRFGDVATAFGGSP
jgi:hypothetical protein